MLLGKGCTSVGEPETEWCRQRSTCRLLSGHLTLWEGRQLGWASTAADTQHTTGLPLQDSGVGSSEWGPLPGSGRKGLRIWTRSLRYTPMLSVLQGLRQEVCELEVSLVYNVSSRVAWA